MRLFHEIEGSGPALLLTHGWTMSHRFFQKQKALAERFRLIFWDLPGHGDSEKNPEGYRFSDCSEAMRQLVTDLKLESVIGLGWSMGSLVQWDYLKRYGPEPFVGLINVDAAPWVEEEKYRVSATRFAMEKNRERASPKFIQKMFRQKPEEEVLRWMVEESLKTPTETAVALYEQMARCDFRDVFQETKIPLLSLMARHGFEVEAARQMERLRPDFPVIWFEESGHMPFWEESEKFNELIRCLEF